MNDPELKKVGIWVGAGLIGIAILNSVYQAGVAAGLGRDGRYVDHDGGLFPFPLLLLGGLAFFFYARRRGNGGGNGNGNGRGRGQVGEHAGRGFGRGPAGPPRFFEEWHRRAHEHAPFAGGSAQPPVTPPTPPVSSEADRSGTGSSGAGTSGPTTL